jgi:hypothetical protein
MISMIQINSTIGINLFAKKYLLIITKMGTGGKKKMELKDRKLNTEKNYNFKG